MKIVTSTKYCFRAVLALLLALLPVLCSCTNLAQKGAIQRAYGSYDKGAYAKALRRLSEAETFGEMPDQRHAEVYYLKGRCLEGMGNRDEAASLYEYLIKKYPDSEFGARAHGRLEELRPAPEPTRAGETKTPPPVL
jgi:outer membrane protein assembly factor BamD (BamD/ComL family)